MVNINSLIPKARIRIAVSSRDGTVAASLSNLAAAVGGDKGCKPSSENSPAEEGAIWGHGTEGHGAELCRYSRLPNGIRSICSLKKVAGFHHDFAAGRPSQLGVFGSQSVKYSFSSVAEAPLPKQNYDNTTAKQEMGKHISKKDKMKFLVNTLLDIKDSKEAVYGVLDAWVAWERNFPIASLKRVLSVLEKEQQWHRVIQVIKWMLSKGQGNTMGTYGQLIKALDKDHRAEEAHKIWVKRIGSDLHSVPWQLCRQMIGIYYRNNMLEELVKLFKGLESFDRKPPEKTIVQRVADAYEMLGRLEEKERVFEKYNDLFTESAAAKKSRKSLSEKNKNSAKENQEAASDNLSNSGES